MTTSRTEPASLRSTARFGPYFAAMWLFFLLDPLLQAWSRRSSARGVVGIVTLLVFGGLYLALWIRARADRARLVDRPPLRVGLAYLAALGALTLVVVGSIGESGLACVVYVAVAAVMVLPVRVAAGLVLGLIGLVIAAGGLLGWGSQLGSAFSVFAAALAVFALRAALNRNIALIAAHQENARLAVDNERTRFARDLHDILGHSLTVITVKAELARRLLDLDPDRARHELADLERLSRDALSDVRRAVEGYRELTLPGELARARLALATAEIEADLPNSTDEVPTELRELFAWTIREGVTNVIRHSGARSCSVRLTTNSAEVCDDGRGAPGGGGGSGVAGLRERAAVVGASVVTRPLTPGYCLRVARP